jgi:hypothetical protein
LAVQNTIEIGELRVILGPPGRGIEHLHRDLVVDEVLVAGAGADQTGAGGAVVPVGFAAAVGPARLRVQCVLEVEDLLGDRIDIGGRVVREQLDMGRIADVVERLGGQLAPDARNAVDRHGRCARRAVEVRGQVRKPSPLTSKSTDHNAEFHGSVAPKLPADGPVA